MELAPHECWDHYKKQWILLESDAQSIGKTMGLAPHDAETIVNTLDLALKTMLEPL